jgi:amidophosphoribosyltransferase
VCVVVAQLLIHGVGVLCFRDPWGIRPLCYGTGKSAHGVDFACASESVALDSLRFEMEGDVQSGEAILATFDGAIHKRMCHESAVRAPCIFEYVYFARPDTILDGVSVYEARLRMGEHLADKILRLRPDHDIDVVIPIPDTSRTSALECARVLHRPFREGFIKNRYIARTFIMPGQETRKKSVRLKLNTIKAEFRGKNVLLVDDSIVRGTTSRELVLMAREVSLSSPVCVPEELVQVLTSLWQAGATKVYFVSAAPAVRFPNVYGIDIPTRCELVAYGREDDEVADAIGADWVVYQDLDALEDSVRHFNPELRTFDASCFNGVYITGDIDETYFSTSARSQERRTEERVPR